MRKPFVSVLLLLSMWLGIGCSGPQSPGAIDPRLQAMDKTPALAWLRSNRNPSAFATNRFGETSAAVAFVEGLHAAGAVEVYVADPLAEPERLREEGGPYADTLLVALPADAKQRAALFAAFAKEATSEGFDPPVDEGQGMELLWWD